MCEKYICDITSESIEICLQLLNHPNVNIAIIDAERVFNTKTQLQKMLAKIRTKEQEKN